MRVLLQRVSKASVSVEGKVLGEISRGLLLLTGFGKGDDESKLLPMLEKIINFRIFPDEKGRFDKSVLDIGGEILVVSQFTLYADTTKGRRPDFFNALEPDKARALCDSFVELLKAKGIAKVACGEFGAHMFVNLENDGPVTIMLEQ